MLYNFDGDSCLSTKAGTDPYALMLAEAKRRGCEALLAFRMNDDHGDLPIGPWRQAIPASPVYGGIECTRGSGQKDLSADEYRKAAAQLLKQGADVPASTPLSGRNISLHSGRTRPGSSTGKEPILVRPNAGLPVYSNMKVPHSVREFHGYHSREHAHSSVASFRRAWRGPQARPRCCPCRFSTGPPVTQPRDVTWDSRGHAEFNGRSALLEVPASPPLRLGTKDFTVALWLHLEAILDDSPGDLLTLFDPAKQAGFSANPNEFGEGNASCSRCLHSR